jgi:hypothetical protein
LIPVNIQILPVKKKVLPLPVIPRKMQILQKRGSGICWMWIVELVPMAVPVQECTGTVQVNANTCGSEGAK